MCKVHGSAKALQTTVKELEVRVALLRVLSRHFSAFVGGIPMCLP